MSDAERNREIDARVLPVASALPPQGFIRQYVRWAVTQTDAPEWFHVGTALTVLSTLVDRDAKVGFGASSQALNLFTMIVGGSGSSRKSTATGFGEKLLNVVAEGSRAGSRFGSYEAMINCLSERPVQCVCEPEFSRFLSSSATKTQGYLAALKTGLTDVYDSSPISRVTVKHDTGRIENYRLSLLAAISGSYLSEYSEPPDFQGGFLSRWLFMWGDRKSFMPLPDSSHWAFSEQEDLIDTAQRIHDVSPTGRFELETSGPTWDAYLAWATRNDAMARGAEPKLQGVYERAPALLRRIAALYAVDRMMAAGIYRVTEASYDPLAPKAKPRHLLTLSDLTYAAHVVVKHLKSAETIVSTVAHSKDAREKAAVLECLPIVDSTPVAPGTPVPVGSAGVPVGRISAQVGMMRKRVTEILQTLEDEQLASSLVVTESNKMPMAVWRRTPMQRVEAAPPPTASAPAGAPAAPVRPAAPVMAPSPAPPAAVAHYAVAAADEIPEYDYGDPPYEG